MPRVQRRISAGTGAIRDADLSDFAEAEYRAKLQHAIGEQYELGELIGQGGFGTVYRAHDVVLARSLAIKVLRHDLLPTPDLTERFRREAQAIAKLQHPNILPLFVVGEGHGLIYMISGLSYQLSAISSCFLSSIIPPLVG